jgi:predicted short-subunit dehydrogenase-like oxidoreductase (DUF2520 family)
LFQSVCIVGTGRAGSVLAARLRAAGVAVRLTGRELDVAGADLVLLAVPDRAIAETAAALSPGPWLAHVSGATSLSALDPHVRRFGLHPLQSLDPARGPEQLDGVHAAVGGESPEALAAARALAAQLGLEPFELDDGDRILYHAGAAIASNFLVTLHEAAAELFRAAGAPPEAIEQLMRGTIANGFLLNGPIARGDWAVVEAHRHAIAAAAPQLEALYSALADATRAVAAR